MGYATPTPIQAQAIPAIVAGKDIVGCAQTGTGKTAAFVLPLLQRIAGGGKSPRALIVTPTRELAVQIDGVARQASQFTKHRVAAVYGGVGYQPQAKALRRGVDVVVATPGRLLDLCSNRDCDLSHVEVLVLDEADRMLDMGFLPDVKRILAMLPKSRQNLLFSATMSPEVMRVAGDTLHEPVHIDVSPPSKPISLITQSVYPVSQGQKMDLLLSLINDHRLERVLVFTRTKHRADKVAKVLARSGIRGAAIHGNRSQSQRQEALEGFKRGRHRVLVATDIVARGIDVEDISHVINFDLPNVPEDYVHRIGRTARAGRSGTAFSLFAPEEHDQLRDIEKTIDAVLDCTDHDGFEYSETRMVPDPERVAKPTRQQQQRVTPGSGRKGRAGGSARRNRGSAAAVAGSGGGQASDARASGQIGKHVGGDSTRGGQHAVSSPGAKRTHASGAAGTSSGQPANASGAGQRAGGGRVAGGQRNGASRAAGIDHSKAGSVSANSSDQRGAAAHSATDAPRAQKRRMTPAGRALLPGDGTPLR
jgi:ATP-dependent RNA helicase RhlE